MRCPPSVLSAPPNGRTRQGGQAMPEFAIIAVLVAVAGIGAAGLLSNAFGSSRPAAGPSQLQVTSTITDHTNHRSVMSKDAARQR